MGIVPSLRKAVSKQSKPLNAMNNRFDTVEFVNYLRSQWRAVLICCAVALLLTGIVTFILPKRYTATASLVIQPPAGEDPRGATAISPVYIESLKTYEHYAASDTLFSQALDHLHLRERYLGKSTEALKSSVLRVSKPASTTVLEISATLRDPDKAQALAEYIAGQAVALNRSLNERSARDLAKEAQNTLDSARLRFENAAKVRGTFTQARAVETLSDEVSNSSELKFQIERDLGEAKAELASLIAQNGSSQPSEGDKGQADWVSQEIAAARAKTSALENQDRSVTETVASKGALLEQLKLQRESLEAEEQAARAGYEAAKVKLADVQSAAAFRGERLEMLDPGIVPQRPSFPNPGLNLAIAFLTSLFGCLLYLAVRYGFTRLPAAEEAAAKAERAYSLR